MTWRSSAPVTANGALQSLAAPSSIGLGQMQALAADAAHVDPASAGKDRIDVADFLEKSAAARLATLADVAALVEGYYHGHVGAERSPMDVRNEAIELVLAGDCSLPVPDRVAVKHLVRGALVARADHPDDAKRLTTAAVGNDLAGAAVERVEKILQADGGGQRLGEVRRFALSSAVEARRVAAETVKDVPAAPAPGR